MWLPTLWMMFIPGLASAQSAGPKKHARRHPGHRKGQLRLGSSGRHCHFGNCRLHRPAYSDHRPSRGFPLFRRGARKLQDHDRRLWIRRLDSGERGGRFGRQSTVAIRRTAGGCRVLFGERYSVRRTNWPRSN